jgi:hypothetical protein
MITEGRGGIQVHQVGRRILITRKREGVIAEAGVGGGAVPVHPLAGMGFFAYTTSGDTPSVVISSGAVRLQFNQGFSNLDSDGDDVMDPVTLTNFTPGTSGYLVFRYAQALREDVSTAVSGGLFDFGFPGELYSLTVVGNANSTTEESTTVEDEGGILRRYAMVFLADLPEPSSAYFHRIICRITVSTDGQPSVQQVHIGDILVPVGYSGFVTGISSVTVT